MLAFRLTFRAGVSLFDQVVYAAKKAIISGQMRPGDAFPSVRALSKELKINPNTAHKIVAHLIAEGLLEMRPGLGTVVAALPESTQSERTAVLGQQIEELVVEAKRLGIAQDEMLAAVAAHWLRLSATKDGQPGDTE